MSSPIPPQLTIPIGPGNSGEISLLVGIGERVLKYQKLAVMTFYAEGRSEVPVHAPTSGVIISIEDSVVADHSQQQQRCITLASDGHDEAKKIEGQPDYVRLGSAGIVSKIRDAGIIGMGGAGFPTADKLAGCGDAGPEFLIINAAECEPYITADEALLRERADSVVMGAKILKQASAARRCIFAIEDTKPDAIAALQQALKEQLSIAAFCELVLIPSKYPAGSERQLIQCVTGIEVTTGLHPTENGVLMHNVGTAYAVYEAIVNGKPCISRFTTLCGQALKTPKNFEVLIGTATDYLFELCGIEPTNKQKSILGGSLMGNELTSDKAVICKTTNCLIAASANEIPASAPEKACIRCGFCADACPSRLLPQQLLAFSRTSDTTQLLEHGLFDCIDCGACDYVCPSHIPLVSTFKESKTLIENHEQSLLRSDYWQHRFQFRQYRIKKEKDQVLSRKKEVPEQPVQIAEQAPNTQNNEADIISKEQASRDIAAAVARVKARRDEKNK